MQSTNFIVNKHNYQLTIRHIRIHEYLCPKSHLLNKIVHAIKDHIVTIQ